MKHIKLSIIIVSWNVEKYLVNCLSSIEKNRPSVEYEIIVVDNASTDGIVDRIRRDFPNVCLVENISNIGFAAANNQGIEMAKGQYLFLLNPDTIVHPDAMDSLTKYLDEHEDVGACGPKLVREDGSLYILNGSDPTVRSLLYGKTIFRSLGIFRGHYKKLKNRKYDFNKQTQFDQLSGSAIMVRKSVITEIGMMDENFFLYFEDVDLCVRLRKAGWKLVYVPDAVITHIGGRSSVHVSAKKQMMLLDSLFVYFRKHHGRFVSRCFSLIFKPSVIIKEIVNFFSGLAGFGGAFLIGNGTLHLKSAAKIKKSMDFLKNYTWQLLFRT